jgi:histidyl-tRNA synthetase
LSIGFERIVDLLGKTGASDPDAVVLVHEKDADPAALVALKAALVATGLRVRLERRTKNLKALLDRATATGYGRYAFVTSESIAPGSLQFRPLGD